MIEPGVHRSFQPNMFAPFDSRRGLARVGTERSQLLSVYLRVVHLRVS